MKKTFLIREKSPESGSKYLCVEGYTRFLYESLPNIKESLYEAKLVSCSSRNQADIIIDNQINYHTRKLRVYRVTWLWRLLNLILWKAKLQDYSDLTI